MALRTITLAGTVDQWKTSYNSLATDVGDLSLLGTTHDSNLVLAINELIGEFDSAIASVLARKSISAGAGIGYDSSTGIITASRPYIRQSVSAGSGIGYDSGTGVISLSTPTNSITNAMMADSAIGTAELRNNAVTYQKMQTIATANRILGSTSAGGAVSEVQLQSAMIASGAVDSASLKAAVVTSSKLASAVTLIIYNSAGSALKTLYGAGS